MPRVGRLFTDRSGGTSRGRYATANLSDQVGDDPAAVAENRRRVAAATGLPASRTVWMRQVHGATAAQVRRPGGPLPATDAMATAVPGLVLAVLAADCVPVLLADPSAGVVAVAHAGRRGLLAGVLPAVLQAMTGLGASPHRVRATLGPAICPGCYEVPEPMRDEVSGVIPEARATTRHGTPGLDLPGAVAAVLSRLGVRDVHLAGSCTAENPACYSYRRDGQTGRSAGLVWLRPGVGPPGGPR